MPQGGRAYIGPENTTILTKHVADSTTNSTEGGDNWYKILANALGSIRHSINYWTTLYNERIAPAGRHGGTLFSLSCIILLSSECLSTATGIFRWLAAVKITPFLRRFCHTVVSFIWASIAKMESLI